MANIYFGSINGYIYALSSDKNLLWKYNVGSPVNGKVIGIDNFSELRETLPNKISNLMGVNPDVNLHTKGKLYFIEIIAEPHTVANSLRGRFYKRIGTVTRELTGTNLNEFLLQKAGRTWDYVWYNFVWSLGCGNSKILSWLFFLCICNMLNSGI